MFPTGFCVSTTSFMLFYFKNWHYDTPPMAGQPALWNGWSHMVPNRENMFRFCGLVNAISLYSERQLYET